ncbi:Na+/H+ antiporter NhaC family protein [Murimonas intestini]|uniref:Methionine transporter (NhaC family) n=1 Tax=Murimonas intestini TaxID=1337051 RepID=A0AB73SY24_9FIRM|nr:Na+/H+ antiporter NhaC family protein [Murimonas intestini]MCR1843082.1 Na+/H+ antiporter NhaC family protein [Murimonas intestini]MCR1868391.1 Na+/H+ antiporter NhaC family protein [Murimonas intestini]MCR1885835.1 Na+/H+ antiporter NhaC family protein [Murimonas intestini]
MEKGKLSALLPIGVFLAAFLGISFISGDFRSMPAIVGFLMALLCAFLQNRKMSFEEKISVVAKGVGEDNIVTMCLIFLAAGGFSGAVTAAGGMESTVNFSLSVLPSGVAVAGLMLIACFISLSMGTSMGTIGALAPIAVGISQKTGFSAALCIGAVVCGAMFGDNLSMISDTTIAAVKTQGCEMKDKFKANFLIVLPAAVVSLIIFLIITRNTSYTVTGELPYELIKILPYLLVLLGALAGINVFIVLTGGTVLSLIIGAATGTIPVTGIFNAVGDGVKGMYDITVISLVVACIVAIVRHNGGIAYILSFIKGRIKGKRGAELGIAVLALLVDMTTANNTVAIVIAGPIAKEISTEYGISPKRSASLLDIFAAAAQGMIPYGAQLLLAAEATGCAPFEIMPYLFYPFLMAVSAILFIVFRKKDSREEMI